MDVEYPHVVNLPSQLFLLLSIRPPLVAIENSLKVSRFALFLQQRLLIHKHILLVHVLAWARLIR